MAECVSPILDLVTRLWDCITNRAVYICDLEDNLNSLRDLKGELEDISKDVEKKADLEEQQRYAARTNQMKGLLERVQLKLKEVDAILQKGDEEIHQKCLGSCCPRHCCTAYKLGKQVCEEIDAVKKLIEKFPSLVVVDEVPPPMIDEMPMEKIVGMESRLDEVWKCVENHEVGIIGLYGMGGVGKTTLLKKLNNKFLEASLNFGVVIWVDVSKQVKLDVIQETILKKLNISKDLWIDKSEEERASQILRGLHNKRFVLLLDDLWDWLDLSKLGVSCSNNQNGFKIVFTTRSRKVCGQMRAKKPFKLEGLPQEAALRLFRQNVGEDVLNSHHELPKLAEIVAEECAGLPLALVTIGRAMASRTMPEDWRRTINVLKTYPSRFFEMGEKVFPVLRFSYDSLSDDTLKKCFLYCSIFPEDHNISNRELIELWIGEGFLDDSGNMYKAQQEGGFIINSLKLACLLEESYEKDHVKMHDVLRDMAHWITRDDKNEILVKEHAGLINSQGIERWKEAVRVSLHGKSTEFLIETPIVCPRLQTIFVMGSKLLETLPGTLFQSIHALTVLNLSNNEKLSELPLEIGALINLHYLNLSMTSVNNLPIEVKNLTQLRILLLDEMMPDELSIPPEVISSLSSLEMYSSIDIEYSDQYKMDMKLIMEELECLEKITNVGLTFSSVSPFLKFMSFNRKLQGCIARLSIKECEKLHSLDISCSSMRSMEHLEELYIGECRDLMEVKICFENGERMPRSELNCFRNLQTLQIWKCELLVNLTWLIYTPRLRSLSVWWCKSLKEIIAWDFAGSSEIEEATKIFSNLEQVYLDSLPKLKSICRRALPFPSLRDIEVYGCQRLRKLPFNAESAKSTLKSIKGDNREWWDKLQWEDEATNLAFTSKFQPSY